MERYRTESKTKEKAEAEQVITQEVANEILASKVKPFGHPIMKSKMEKTLE